MGTIFTIGHGARPLADFLDALANGRVDLLIDVRRYPGSRRHPHFGREALASVLAHGGIGYEWWGPSMGGRREAGGESEVRHRSWKNASFRAYAAHMDTAKFRDALSRLIELSDDHRVAIMCAETLWWRCHRRLIADALLAEGCEVMHLGAGDPERHRMTPSARVDENGLLAYDLVEKQ
ncbi:MAG: DUF488 domain-containing protein [Actinomycetota bacterium]|nr:DUF488 domain-containing protein [Actinomycetota bacterium]